MASIFNLPQNVSLYTIPVAWFLCLVPRVYAAHLYEKVSAAKFDNRYPRHLTKTVMECQNIDSCTKGRIVRAEMAQQNGFDNIGLFATAVIAGNMANISHTWLNAMSVGYLISRIIYNLIFINNTTLILAWTRTAVFMSGVAMILTMFVLAGNKLALQQIA